MRFQSCSACWAHDAMLLSLLSLLNRRLHFSFVLVPRLCIFKASIKHFSFPVSPIALAETSYNVSVGLFRNVTNCMQNCMQQRPDLQHLLASCRKRLQRGNARRRIMTLSWSACQACQASPFRTAIVMQRFMCNLPVPNSNFE